MAALVIAARFAMFCSLAAATHPILSQEAEYSAQISCCRVDITIEASLAIAVGFNLLCILVVAVYIITLKVDPEDFRWLQPKPKDAKDGIDAKVKACCLRSLTYNSQLKAQSSALYINPEGFKTAPDDACKSVPAALLPICYRVGRARNGSWMPRPQQHQPACSRCSPQSQPASRRSRRRSTRMRPTQLKGELAGSSALASNLMQLKSTSMASKLEAWLPSGISIIRIHHDLLEHLPWTVRQAGVSCQAVSPVAL